MKKALLTALDLAKKSNIPNKLKFELESVIKKILASLG
jgi:hypothetical protein